MPIIHSIGTIVPTHSYSQEQVMHFVEELFADIGRMDRYQSIYKNTGIKKRHFCQPMEWYRHHHSFQKKNALFIDHALKLGALAIEKCLEKVNLTLKEIDHIFMVTSTGISTPSLDAMIMNRMDFNPHIKRTPIWGLGCAGGAAGLSRAYEFTRAFPEAKALLVTIELCSLTFLTEDHSKSNIVATSLFADGAAAVLVGGDQTSNLLKGAALPKIINSMSTIYPNSLDVMGWEVQDDGLKVIFSRDIPTIVKHSVKENMVQFLTRQGLTLQNIDHFILHPGGTKVLKAYEEALEIAENQTSPSREVFQMYGNMSSATVLFVLERMLESAKSGEYGLLAALGPGFSSEQVLIQWE